MKRYRFKREYVVKDAEGRIYAKGEVVELSEASARHFDRKKLITLVGAENEEERPIDITRLNKADLLAHAAEQKIEIPEGATNKQIRELIEAG